MLARFAQFSIFIFCLAVLFALGGCQSNADNIQTPNGNISGENQQQVRALLDQYIAALQHRDLDALDRIWANELTFINPYGELLNKQNRMDNIKSGATAFKSIKLSEVDVRMYGQAAVATFKIEIEAHYSGQESSGNYRVTTVWAQPKDQWQLVAVDMTEIK